MPDPNPFPTTCVVARPPEAPAGFFPRFCWLYRLFDESGRLLYVGITRMGRDRIVAHARKPWGRFIAEVDWRWFAERHDAELAEATAIATERPLFNVMVNAIRLRRAG